MNPGDKKHTVSNIKKITSGSTPKITDLVDNLYNEIVKMLIDEKADVNTKNNNGDTALSYASMDSYNEIVKILENEKN